MDAEIIITIHGTSAEQLDAIKAKVLAQGWTADVRIKDTWG